MALRGPRARHGGAPALGTKLEAGSRECQRHGAHRERVSRPPATLLRGCRDRTMRVMSATPSDVTSYWWREPGPTYPPLASDLDADVLVVGGGIAGVTLAWTLAEQGATVAVLEAARLAAEASGRNAGFLLAIPAEPYAER